MLCQEPRQEMSLRNLLLVRVEDSTKKASFPCTVVRLAMSPFCVAFMCLMK